MSLLRDAAEIEARAAGLNNYIQYVQTLDNRPTFAVTGQGAYNERGTLQMIAVSPFSLDLPNGVFAEAYRSDGAATFFASNLGAHVKVDTASLSGALKLDRFKPAKVKFFNSAGGVTTKQSKFTKLYYRKRNGTTTTCSFGRATATETYGEAVAAIRTAIAISPTSKNKLYFTPEKLSV